MERKKREKKKYGINSFKFALTADVMILEQNTTTAVVRTYAYVERGLRHDGPTPAFRRRAYPERSRDWEVS